MSGDRDALRELADLHSYDDLVAQALQVVDTTGPNGSSRGPTGI